MQNFQDKLMPYFPSLCHLMVDTAQGALPALLPLFISIYGLNYEQAAALIFANTSLASVAQPFFGYLADKKSLTFFIPLGLIMTGASITALGFVDNYYGLILFSTLAGLGSAIFHPEGARWVNRLSKEKIGKAMGLFSVGGNAGFAIGPILAGLAYIWGVHLLTLFVILNTLIAVLYAILVPKEKTAPVNDVKKANAPAATNDWKSFSRLSVVITARSINFAVLNTFIPIYWISHLMQSTSSANFALSLFFFCGVIVTLWGGILSDRIGFIKVIRYSYLLLVPIMFAFTTSDSYWLSMSLLFPLSIGVFAQYSPIVVLGQTYLAKSIGFASGITLGVGITLGGMVAPLIGKLADTYGLQHAWMVLNVVCLIALLFSYLLKDKQPTKVAHQ